MEKKLRLIKDFLFFYTKETIEKPKKGIGASFLRGVLFFFSLFFKSASYIKNTIYDRKWLTSKKAAPTVVSIGNIVAGGTGKTPLISLLLERLEDKKVCLLSRGYRSKLEKDSFIACKGKGPLYDWKKMGDESYMLARKFPSCFIVVGKKRYKALGIDFVKSADVILLDDGMQYKKIQKDIQIVCMHANNLFGEGHFLPRGFLRDHPKRLACSDAIFVNHVQDEKNFSCLKKQISKYTSAPIIGMRPKLKTLRSYDTQKILNIKNKKVGLFCSIANPASFYQLMQEQGLEVVATNFALDHRPISKKNLDQFAHLCVEKKATFLICTEKDYVKLPEITNLSLPIVYSEICLEVICNKGAFEELIEKIIRNMQ